jgi:hypothetical protein
MATLLLSTAGAAVGSIFGPVGAVIGRAVGAVAGYALDQSLFATERTVETGRLADLDVQTSREGAPIPRVYGRVRIAGEMIWATRFEEEVREREEGGGKGGSSETTVRRFLYFANFAIGLCEGPIARIGRVWADGKPFDLDDATWRLHRGTGDQEPDSLIEAKQGGEGTPAYRDTAYIVFERLPLARFGNRIPHFSFEVIRPVGALEKKVRAITMIPGATEFGYAPEIVREVRGPGHRRPLNRHTDRSRSDWRASLGELRDLCPNLESVGLVATWFGNDLRANHCEIRPGVVSRTIVTAPSPWRAAGLTRATAHLVSTHDGRAAYGGTPSDQSVVDAIRDLKERGLDVMFYPFVMMDIPEGNGLVDPYGGAEQGAYPWRGMITASKAPGQPGSPDKTAEAAEQVAAFVGEAAPGDFTIAGDNVLYDGPEEWSFRRLVLHYAQLCKAAGGVDAFLIGSEMRGLTTLRSSATDYPFVAALVEIAADVRQILGAGTKISYAADWTEYFGHHPEDGSGGDVFFHLDPLWASEDVHFVGIDNYMPLADWRDGASHLDAAPYDSGRSAAYLRANVAGGEGYDWYYRSKADRDAQTRTPITDGAYGRPWVFRFKDLKAWWQNQHFDRPGGVEATSPTGWMPQSKPIWFTELGCPAVDKGSNQPNLFPDPKSSAAGIPYYSSGARDDVIQRRHAEAVLGYFDPDDPDYVAGSNPAASNYDGRMLRSDRIHLWTWDARPYPAFPAFLDVWGDGENWETGHWLTGRLGAAPGSDLVAAILADYGIEDVSVGEIDGVVDGYLIDGIVSARRALEPLASLLLFEAFESGDKLRIERRGRKATASFVKSGLADEPGRALFSLRRAQESELPQEIAIGFSDPLADFRMTEASARRLVTGSGRTARSATGTTLTHSAALGFAEAMLQDIWAGREMAGFALPRSAQALEPGDVCTVTVEGRAHTLLVTRIEDGAARRIEARSIDPAILTAVPHGRRLRRPRLAPRLSAPEVLLLDLPLINGGEPPFAPRVAAFARPWPGAVAIALGTAEAGFLPRQAVEQAAVMGELAEPLGPGPLWRFDHANTILVRLYGGTLAGLPELALLNGGNIAAVGSAETGFEVLQFRLAELVDADTYRLRALLRGQAGTGDIAAAGHDTGARFVLLDGGASPLALAEAESGLGLVARCGPADTVYDPDLFVDVPVPTARRGLRCLAPVHLRARRDPSSGDVIITWVRQTRLGGDGWEPEEVPLGEATEAYRLNILDGPAVVRTVTVPTPAFVYAAAEQVSDFGSLPATIAFRVRQVSATEGPGTPAERVFAF